MVPRCRRRSIDPRISVAQTRGARSEMSDLDSIVDQAIAQFAATSEAAELENVKARYLGKGSSLTERLKALGRLPADERREAGASINAAKARIEQGEEIPYQVATSSGATSIQFKNASLRLEVTPQITPEGGVIMDLDVSKDSRGVVTSAGPAINKKQAKTQVLVENGGTVVIGGIFTQTERDDVTKVPFLGDVPVVGNLFKNRTRLNNKTELLIFITPKIVTDRSAAVR